MVDVNYLLMGFVVGFAAGIFLAYKIAQHSRNKPLPVQKRYEPPANDFERVEVLKPRERLR